MSTLQFILKFTVSILHHIEYSTIEYNKFTDKLSKFLSCVIFILILVWFFISDLFKLNYEDNELKYKFFVFFFFKFLWISKFFVLFLVILIQIFFLLLFIILLILTIKKIFNKEKSNTRNFLNNNIINSKLNLLIIHLWINCLNFIIFIIIYIIMNILFCCLLTYNKPIFVVNVEYFIFAMLILFYVLYRIPVTQKIIKTLVDKINSIFSILSLIIELAFVFFYLYSKYLNNALIFSTILGICILLLQNFWKKYINTQTPLFFQLIEILFASFLATINIFILCWYIQYLNSFLTCTTTLLNINCYLNNSNIYLIFIFINTIIFVQWLKLNKHTLLIKTNIMLNIFNFLIFCLSFFYSIYIIGGIYLLTDYGFHKFLIILSKPY